MVQTSARLSCHIGFTPWMVIRPCPNYPNLEAFWLLRTLPSSKVPRRYSVHIAHCLIPLTSYQERGQLYKLKAKKNPFCLIRPHWPQGREQPLTRPEPWKRILYCINCIKKERERKRNNSALYEVRSKDKDIATKRKGTSRSPYFYARSSMYIA